MQIPFEILRTVVDGLAGLKLWRLADPALRQVLIERGHGSVRFIASDGEKVLVYLWPSEPAPLTPLARRMAEARWEREGTAELALNFIELRRLAENANGEPFSLTDAGVGLPVHFPSAVPPLETLRPGWNQRNLAVGRADLRALAASF